MYLFWSYFFFSSRRRHTRWPRDWSSDVCSSDLQVQHRDEKPEKQERGSQVALEDQHRDRYEPHHEDWPQIPPARQLQPEESLPRQRHAFAVIYQISGKENRQNYLRKFGALERKPKKGNPNSRAINLPANYGSQGQQQEP